MKEMTTEEILARFVYELSYDDLPDAVVAGSEVSMIDAIACAFAGSKLPSSKIAMDVWKKTKTDGDVSVWVTGEKGNEETTAWLNCLTVHSMLHDDTLVSTVGHMGSMIVPTAYAIAEQRGIGGKELLTAIVAAYEVAGKLSMGTGDLIVSRGFRGSPVFGTFAAATAAGKLLNLSQDQMRSAIALAGNFSCGLLQASNKGSMEWRFQNGAALKGGIMAAYLAQSGLSAAEESLEGKFGFFTVFGGADMSEAVMSKRNALKDALGNDFEIVKNLYKPYATCGYNQAGVEVMLGLLKDGEIRPDDIDRIDIVVQPENERYPGGSHTGPFNSIDQALLSKPFSIAAALKYKSVTVDRYLTDMNEPDLLQLAQKVYTTSREGMDYLDVEINISMKNGEKIKGDGSLVDKRNHMPGREQAGKKFCDLTAGMIDGDKAQGVVDAIFALPAGHGVNTVTEAIRSALR